MKIVMVLHSAEFPESLILEIRQDVDGEFIEAGERVYQRDASEIFTNHDGEQFVIYESKDD